MIPGLYYHPEVNILCLVYPDQSCEKNYLGAGGALIDDFVLEDIWYAGFVLPNDTWEFVGEL